MLINVVRGEEFLVFICLGVNELVVLFFGLEKRVIFRKFLVVVCVLFVFLEFRVLGNVVIVV